jgi:hypothetical protein
MLIKQLGRDGDYHVVLPIIKVWPTKTNILHAWKQVVRALALGYLVAVAFGQHIFEKDDCPQSSSLRDRVSIRKNQAFRTWSCSTAQVEAWEKLGDDG